MEYKYVASTADGKMISGVMDSDSEETVEQNLWKSGLTIIELNKKITIPPLYQLLPSLFSVKQRDVIDFSRNFASLLQAGIPVLRSLELLTEHGVTNPTLKNILRQVTGDLHKGSRLSEAMAKHEKAFPNFYTQLIKVGEEVGNLSQVLNDVSAHMEKDAAMVSKVRGALAYPSFVFLMAIGAIVIMMTFVVPNLTKLFEELGGELPLQTRILVSTSDFFEAAFVYLILGVIVLGVSIVAFLRTATGKKAKDSFILKIPVIGPATLKATLARFATNLSMLVGSGISVADALTLVSQNTNNILLTEALARVRTRVGQGDVISQAMAKDAIFPPLMVQMISIGEETGSLESSLTKVAKYYEEQADRAMSRVVGMLTPAITLFVGAIIGFIAVAMYGSLYSVSSIDTTK